MYSNRKVVVFFIIVVLLVCFVNVVFAYGDGDNDGEYYWGYGDSIMRATGYDELNNDYTDCFVTVMRETYDALKSDDHNTDGGGQASDWGLSHFASNYDSGNDYFIFMFGANDGNDGVSISETASNMVEMYNKTLDNGTTPILCIMTMCGDDHSQTYSNTRARINATEDLCETYSIPYIKLYDAIDADEWNGRPAPDTGGANSWLNMDYYANEHNVHPNKDGHEEMADFLWYFLSGNDYDTTYWGGNDTLMVDVDYNETIYIDNSYYSWSTGSLYVHCIGNNTNITYSLHTARGGSQMINFLGIKNEAYLISDTWDGGDENTAPNAPTSPDPENHETAVSLSPTLSVTAVDLDGDTMSVYFHNASNDALIGTDTGVANNSVASVVWSGLAYSKSYSWYAIANDTQANSSQSSTWDFTTQGESSFHGKSFGGVVTVQGEGLVDISIRSINFNLNNSVTQENHRFFNWTRNEGATTYSIRIGNSLSGSNVSSVFVQLDNITISSGWCSNSWLNNSDSASPYDYNYWENETTCFFYLPFTFNITGYGYDYYQVRYFD